MNFRKHAPPLGEIQNIRLKAPIVHQLSNGILVHEINMGTQDILKLDILFHAGRWYEKKRLAARSSTRMLREGTTTYNSAELAEEIDFYGGTLRINGGLDTAFATLYCLTKHFKHLLPLLKDILTNPVFPEKEFNEYVQATKQQLLVEQKKNDIVAYREITALMFGQDHPYGYNSTIDDYNNLRINDLQTHFESNFHSANCELLLSGKTTPEMIRLLNEVFGQDFQKGKKYTPSHTPSPVSDKKLSLQIPDSLQTAIRIGRPLVPRKHEDYQGLFVLNNLLGGYFGSRLMMNIREEKGYTYGIYSSIDSMLNGSYFYISTETSHDVSALTQKEIYKELKSLRNKPVTDQELSRVRNYMLGNILTSLDGPINVAALNKMLVLEKLDGSYMEKLVEVIKTITPGRLQELANQYFQEEDLYEVLVG